MSTRLAVPEALVALDPEAFSISYYYTDDNPVESAQFFIP